MSQLNREGFWKEAFALQGSVTPHVMPNVILTGVFAGLTCLAATYTEKTLGFRLGLEITPYEFAGAVLGLLLVFRTNSGYDRWWEARKIWGGIVNQSRNLVISGLSYGPQDAHWRDAFVRWAAAFPHIARHSLRGEAPSVEVHRILGEVSVREIKSADHMPMLVAMKLGSLLREAIDKLQMDRFTFLQVDRERALLIDHIGACERILKTPLPRAYSVKIRRFIVLFLITLPFGLLHRTSSDWLVPLITMLVAYPLLSLDQIGVEMENPFSKRNLSHLPLDDISATIERNTMAVLKNVSLVDHTSRVD